MSAEVTGAATHTQDLVARLNADAAPEEDTRARQAEELKLLMIGVGTGMSIAGVFLIYIIFEYARLLP